MPQKNYDIVAVKPLNERIFHAICTEYEVINKLCRIMMSYVLIWE